MNNLIVFDFVELEVQLKASTRNEKTDWYLDFQGFDAFWI
jgi:hypothetical protein